MHTAPPSNAGSTYPDARAGRTNPFIAFFKGPVDFEVDEWVSGRVVLNVLADIGCRCPAAPPWRHSFLGDEPGQRARELDVLADDLEHDRERDRV